MPELLLELLSEEIPARMQRRAIEDLTGLIRDKLAAAGLGGDAVRGYVTPRRLAVIATGIAATQPDRTEERRGPRVGAPQAAIDGFLRSAGVASVAACEIRDTGRGEFYFAIIERPGRAAAAVLPELLHAAIKELPWPKSMRFPAASLRWVRPLTSVVCLLDDAVLPLPLDDVPVGRVTRGHRFLSEGEITIGCAAEYAERLREVHVVLEYDRRKEMISDALCRLAAAEGLTVKPDPGLLEEVAGLVEFPSGLIGAIDADFMTLPPEVLATAMRTHQKYFSCLNADGAPATRFLFVANNLTPDGGQTIVAGNERVLRARLADARFFWDQDRKVRLEDRVGALKDRVFHAKLGSMRQKVDRVEKLAVFIADQVRWPEEQEQSIAVMPGLVPGIHAEAANAATRDQGVGGRDKPGHDDNTALRAGSLPAAQRLLKQLAKRAALLAKADLSTGMVGEFPELQGIVGRYYALHDGEDPRVADAIAEHYKPLGPNDSCPAAPESIVVALADKIDTLVAFFWIDERPSGSRDPFGLRRAALGISRLIRENNLRLPLRKVFLHTGTFWSPDWEATGELLDFVVDRMKVHLRERGFRHDLIAAAFSQVGEGGTGVDDDLVRVLERAEALAVFVALEDGTNLLTAYRRASNIVDIERRRGGWKGGEVEPSRFRQLEEHLLAERLDEVSTRAAPLNKKGAFIYAMAELARLREPVDTFFNKVTVNTDDPELRQNRLRLLSRIHAVMNQVADFSQIEG